MSEITKVLKSIEDGDANAAAELLPLVYEALRKLAAAQLADVQAGRAVGVSPLVQPGAFRATQQPTNASRSPRRLRWVYRAASILILLACGLAGTEYFGLTSLHYPLQSSAVIVVDANDAEVRLTLFNEQDGTTSNLGSGESKIEPGFYRVDARRGRSHRIDAVFIAEGNHTREVSKETFQVTLARGSRHTVKIRVVPLQSRTRLGAALQRQGSDGLA